MFFKKRFPNLVLAMIALEISLFMKVLWFDLQNRFFRACLSRLFAQISENGSCPFSYNTFFCLASSFRKEFTEALLLKLFIFTVSNNSRFSFGEMHLYYSYYHYDSGILRLSGLFAQDLRF